VPKMPPMQYLTSAVFLLRDIFKRWILLILALFVETGDFYNWVIRPFNPSGLPEVNIPLGLRISLLACLLFWAILLAYHELRIRAMKAEKQAAPQINMVQGEVTFDRIPYERWLNRGEDINECPTLFLELIVRFERTSKMDYIAKIIELRFHDKALRKKIIDISGRHSFHFKIERESEDIVVKLPDILSKPYTDTLELPLHDPKALRTKAVIDEMRIALDNGDYTLLWTMGMNTNVTYSPNVPPSQSERFIMNCQAAMRRLTHPRSRGNRK
jgi:hypothetical protein